MVDKFDDILLLCCFISVLICLWLYLELLNVFVIIKDIFLKKGVVLLFNLKEFKLFFLRVEFFFWGFIFNNFINIIVDILILFNVLCEIVLILKSNFNVVNWLFIVLCFCVVVK